MRRLPPYNALANINATVDCDLPNDFIATDSSPSGARAAFPDNSKGRYLGQCKGDPAQQQWELAWSNKDGSKLQAAHFNAHPKDAKSTVRFSDNSGRDVSKGRVEPISDQTLTLQGPTPPPA